MFVKACLTSLAIPTVVFVAFDAIPLSLAISATGAFLLKQALLVTHQDSSLCNLMEGPKDIWDIAGDAFYSSDSSPPR